MDESRQLDDVLSALARGDLVLIDVRDAEEFEDGHVPGAINIPIEMLGDSDRPELKSGKPVVCNCNGGGRQNQAVVILKGRGLGDVCELAGGYRGWKEQQKDR